MRRRCASGHGGRPPSGSEMARDFGILGPLAAVPATVLGASEVTPLELARAYLPLANRGCPPSELSAVTAVYDLNGTRLDLQKSDAIQVVRRRPRLTS